MKSENIKVLVADDHDLFREGLCRIISDEQGLEVIGEACDGQTAIKLARKHKPDVVLMDVSMPVVDGIEATEKIKGQDPDTAVLIVSAYDYDSYLKAALQAGAAGYLQKNVPSQELIESIKLVSRGKSIFDSEMMKKALNGVYAGNGDSSGTRSPLNKREIDVIRSAAQGNSNKKIAVELCISARTVQSHMVNIFKKLDVSSRTEAVLKAIRSGWIIPSDMP